MATFPTAISTLAGVCLKRHLSAAEAVTIDLGICTQAQAEAELDDKLYGNIDFCERLPYLGIKGEPLGFVRYRINFKDAGTWVDREGKLQTYPKYRQRKGVQQSFVYLPHVGGMDWENLIHNPTEPLWITEGEYKSITACQAGIPTVGLGGIWSFNKKGNNLPAPLDKTVWIGKQVIICFDADDKSTFDKPLKDQVAHAALILASKLSQMGAKPILVYIARTDTFKNARAKDVYAKMGLDDYLLAGGTANELAGTWVEPIQCGHLAALNSQYAVCRGLAGVGVMDIELGKLYRTFDFVKSVENNRIRLVPTGKDGAVKKVSVADEFIHQEDRPEVRQIVFEPAWDVGYDRGQSIYNQWTGWPDLGESGTAEQRREVDRCWRTLIEKLFGEHADYFEKWCAHLVQKPGEKTSIGVILVSVLNGVGKSLLGEILRGIVGNVHGKKTELDRLKSNFNSVLERCLLLQMDEANSLQDGLETKLNDLITSDTLTIERKGFDAVVVNNYMRMYMTTNSTRPIRMSKENRRWLVIHAGVTASELVEWSAWCGTAAKIIKSPSGLAALRERLERIDLREWNPTARVVVTSAMEDMVESSMTWNQRAVELLLDAYAEEWEAGKPWATTGLSKSVHGPKVWDDVMSTLRSRGGRTLAHVSRLGGKPTKITILDLDSSLPAKRDVADNKKWILDVKGDLGRWDTDWGAAVQRSAKARSDIDGVIQGTQRVSSDKY